MFFLFLFLSQALAQTPPQDVASQYSLTTSTTLPFPSATLSNSDTQNWITSSWSLSKGRIQNGGDNLLFVDDPFAGQSTDSNSNSQPVLQVTYEADSYSSTPGGAQFYSLWNTSDGSPFQSMMISYDVAFDPDFDWVQGGKLPGMRGGPAFNGCDGGSQPNGSDCFSSRFMWRPNGAGEVYAYILRPNNLCSERDIICNSDFGISIARGAITFQSGQWNTVAMVVQLNSQTHLANGNILFYYNGVQAAQQQDLQFRKSLDVDIGGLFFSTFFGGSDPSWATPVTTHTYFRNFQLWGSNAPSTLSGVQVSKASGRYSVPSPWHYLFCTSSAAVAAYLLL